MQPTSVLFFVKDFIRDHLNEIGAGASIAGLSISIYSLYSKRWERQKREKQAEAIKNEELEKVKKEFISNLGIANRILHIDGGPLSASGKFNPYHRIAWIALEKAISSYTEGRVRVDIVRDLPTPSKENGAIFGGPNSNALTKIAFEFEGKDPKKLNPRKNFEIPYRFYGLSDIEKLADRDDRAFKMPLKGLGELDHYNWGFIDRFDNNPYRLYNCKLDSKGKPLNDPLLITKVPNIFSDLSSPRNLVFIDGAHSLGTGAFSLLLQKHSLLRQINSVIKGREAFQILFDTEIVKRDKSYVVKDIALMNLEGSDQDPIHVIQDFDFSKLKNYAESRLEEEYSCAMNYSIT